MILGMISIAHSVLQKQSISVFDRSEDATNGAAGAVALSGDSGTDRVVNAFPESHQSGAFPLYLINTSHLEKSVSDCKHYRVKVVVSGNHIEVYEYQRSKVQGIFTGKPTASGDRKGRQRQDNVYRAKKDLERTINANVGRWGETDKFLTVTHKEELEDIDEANYLFNKGIKRLRYHFGDFKYIAVPEIQKRRALSTGKEVIHDHLTTFGLPYVDQKKLTEIWGHGWVWIEKCKDYENPGSYMSKYIGKDFADSRYLHHKGYFTSQGLHGSTEYVGNDLGAIQKDLGVNDLVLSYKNTFENDVLGEIHYFHYIIPSTASSGVALAAEQARAVI